MTEPELSKRWALTALILRLESGLKRMPFRIARLRAMIVFVQPVSGHVANLNSWPLSCGMTVTLRIIGVGLAFPSRTSFTRISFCMDVYEGGGGYAGGGGG